MHSDGDANTRTCGYADVQSPDGAVNHARISPSDTMPDELLCAIIHYTCVNNAHLAVITSLVCRRWCGCSARFRPKITTNSQCAFDPIFCMVRDGYTHFATPTLSRSHRYNKSFLHGACAGNNARALSVFFDICGVLSVEGDTLYRMVDISVGAAHPYAPAHRHAPVSTVEISRLQHATQDSKKSKHSVFACDACADAKHRQFAALIYLCHKFPSSCMNYIWRCNWRLSRLNPHFDQLEILGLAAQVRDD
jgi:hypothetical protein